jgi:hypothetical protein
MSLLDIVQQHLGPAEIQAISQHLGTAGDGEQRD